MIGHSFGAPWRPAETLLGNAVFGLVDRPSVSVTSYARFADTTAGQHADDVDVILATYADARGINYTAQRTQNEAQLRSALDAGTDVVIYYNQRGESSGSAALQDDAAAISIRLNAYCRTGGVVVFLQGGDTWLYARASRVLDVAGAQRVTSFSPTFQVDETSPLARGLEGWSPGPDGWSRILTGEDASSIVVAGSLVGRTDVAALHRSWHVHD